MSIIRGSRSKAFGLVLAALSVAVPLVVSEACGPDNNTPSGTACQRDPDCDVVGSTTYCSLSSGGGVCKPCITDTVATELLACDATCQAVGHVCVEGTCAAPRCHFCAADTPCAAGTGCEIFGHAVNGEPMGQCAPCDQVLAGAAACPANGTCAAGLVCENSRCIPTSCAAGSNDAGNDAAADGSMQNGDAAMSQDSSSEAGSDGGACTTLSLAITQTVLAVGGNAQPAGGGTIVDATYRLAGNVIMYGTFINVANATIGVRISGGATRFERIEMDSDGYTDTRNQALTVSNNQLSLGASICSANPMQLIAYDSTTVQGVTTLVLQWQRPTAAGTTFVETYTSQ